MVFEVAKLYKMLLHINFILQTSYTLRGASIFNRLGFLGGTVIEIETLIIHPDFNPFTYENDIAVITFKNEIIQSRDLFPICLPPPLKNDEITDYKRIDVSGK